MELGLLARLPELALVSASEHSQAFYEVVNFRPFNLILVGKLAGSQAYKYECSP